MAKLDKAEIRTRVHAFFQKSLQTHIKVLDTTGYSENAVKDFPWEKAAHEEALHPDATEGDAEISDMYLGGWNKNNGLNLSKEDWHDNEAFIMQERRKARRDMLDRLIEEIAKRERYDFAPTTEPRIEPTEHGSSHSLRAVIDDYISEHSGPDGWTPKTTAKKQAGLNLLIELLGDDVAMPSISKHDAFRVKQLLQQVPRNRNKHPATRDLPLLEAIKVEGVPKITTVTLNGYISIYSAFFDWAERNGHTELKLFDGMKVKGQKNGKQERKPFSPEAMQKMLRELTFNELGLVKSESHKWATLIAMFTGARLNEICQLDVADVGVEEGIRFISVTDEGEGNKRLKANASRRKVPIHPRLIELGFDKFVTKRAKGVRLFSDYNYCAKNGYGRSLGRWFNDRFAPALGVKSKSHVFHSFRHTMVTRLAQAGIEEPIIQSIVGHERDGVMQQHYFGDGYKLKQLSEALDYFNI